MPLNYTTEGINYEALRYDLVKSVEGFKPGVYFDNAGNPQPTIGVGFNLNNGTVSGAVYAALGIVDDTLRDELDITIEATRATTGEALQAELDAVLEQWANTHPVYDGPTAFTLTEAQSRTAFDQLSLTYETNINNFVAGIPQSRERAVLFSLTYNSVTGANNLLGPGLKAALENGDRAEAWFQIRYYSNGGGDPGIAKRRFVESEVFGLYDHGQGVTDEHARQIYQMFAEHQARILRYEATYGAGAPAYASGANEGDMVAFANEDATLTALTGGVSTLEESFQPAYDFLIEHYAESLEAGLGQTIDFRDILVGESDTANGSTDVAQALEGRERDEWTLDEGEHRDELILGQGGIDQINGGGGDGILWGEAGNDFLNGGDGDDWLVGGEDNDTLNGGQGDDVYVFHPGDGQDTIITAEGDSNADTNDRLRVGETELTGTDAESRNENGNTVWEGGGYTYTLVDGNLQDGGTLEITGGALQADDRITVQNFRNDDLGISLNTQQTITLTIAPFVEVEGNNNEDSNLSSGGLRPIRYELTQPAAAGDRLTLSCNYAGTATLWLRFGEALISLGNGPVTVPLQEGQQTFDYFALISEGNIEDTTDLTLEAVYENSSGDALSDPATLAITLEADDASEPEAGGNNAIVGDQVWATTGSGSDVQTNTTPWATGCMKHPWPMRPGRQVALIMRL
ncbi:MAG: calcium-binding protein [Saccharospirillum sp.]